MSGIKIVSGNSSYIRGYKRVFFLTEFVFRLIGMERYSDVHQTMKLYSMAWVLQCLGEIIKRIGMCEIRNGNGKTSLSCLIKILRVVYEICYNNEKVEVFYNLKSKFEDELKEKKLGPLHTEFFPLFFNLCAKLIK